MFRWFKNKNQRILEESLKSCKDPQIKTYLTTGIANPKSVISKSQFLVLDFETTGLNSKTDQIISVGFVTIKNNSIDISSAKHFLIKTDVELQSENVGIHNLTDDMLKDAYSIKEIIPLILSNISGKFVVAHYKKIEYEFLKNICLKLYKCNIPLIMLDTMKIELNHLNRLQQPVMPGQLRLFNLREKYNLPRYHAHNALEDAIATAELFLAQLCKMGINPDSTPIRSIL